MSGTKDKAVNELFSNTYLVSSSYCPKLARALLFFLLQLPAPISWNKGAENFPIDFSPSLSLAFQQLPQAAPLPPPLPQPPHIYRAGSMSLQFKHPISTMANVYNVLQHRWQTQRPQALHHVLSGLAPCFYWMAAPSSHLTVKKQLHLYSPKITFGPLKATTRLMWPLAK